MGAACMRESCAGPGQAQCLATYSRALLGAKSKVEMQAVMPAMQKL